MHNLDLVAAQLLALTNKLGQVEFYATTLFLLNESNAGSLQLRDSSSAERIEQYNSIYGEVFHEAGQYGKYLEPPEQLTRFNFYAKRPLSPQQIIDALSFLQPTLASVMQSNAGLTNKVRNSKQFFEPLLLAIFVPPTLFAGPSQ